MRFKYVAILMLCALATVISFGIGRTIFRPTLRSLAELRHRYIGAAVGSGFMQDSRYATTLAGQFNLLAVENALKFGPLSPTRGQYDFAKADAIITFAQEHKMQVEAQVLIWQNMLPAWFTGQEWERDEMIEILEEHITTVVGRYRGRILAWIVVNEALGDDGKLGDNIFLRTIGPEYIEMAFRWAHAADPEAQLFYNEARAEGLGVKSDAVYAMVQDFRQRGVPIDGVGLQMHTGAGWSPRPDDVAANMKRLADLGLQVHITEMDVRLKVPPTHEDLNRQAIVYRDLLSVCLAAPNCEAFVMWGFTDRYSWIPEYYPGAGAALIFDENYKPKPAYYALMETLVDKNR